MLLLEIYVIYSVYTYSNKDNTIEDCNIYNTYFKVNVMIHGQCYIHTICSGYTTSDINNKVTLFII